MIESDDILLALKELYRRIGTQSAVAELAGITQSTINAYLNGKAKVENMPLGVFLKLFRSMRIDFFEEDYLVKIKRNTIEVGGKVSGMILQNTKSAIHDVEQNKIGLSPETLSKRLRKDDRFSAEEKLKFLDFLDEQA